MRKTEDQVYGCFGMAMIIITGIIVSILVNGWALSVLWGWFIAPLFGLPELTILQAIGIAMTVNLLTPTNSTDAKEKSLSDRIGAYLGAAIFYPATAVTIGWFISGMI